MKQLVEYIACSIVSNPEAVKVTQEDYDGSVALKLEVAQEDLGKIIGRRGRVAKTIRSLLRVAAVKAETRARLEIT